MGLASVEVCWYSTVMRGPGFDSGICLFIYLFVAVYGSRDEEKKCKQRILAAR